MKSSPGAPTGSALEGTTVAIVVSEGPQPVTVPPNLYGMTVSEAIAALQALGLTPVTRRSPQSVTSSEQPGGGTSVLPGTTVTLYSKYAASMPPGDRRSDGCP